MLVVKAVSDASVTEGLSVDNGVARRSSSCAGVKAPTNPAADSDARRRARGILLCHARDTVDTQIAKTQKNNMSR